MEASETISRPDNRDLVEIFRKMLFIRRVEETILDLFSTGRVSGTTHTCIGQESCAVCLMEVIDVSKDIVLSNHRCHGHFLAYGGSLKGLLAEVMGLSCGVSRGLGGSQHLHWRNFYSNGILGGMASVAAGIAFAEKQEEQGRVVVLFIGDGALGEGSVYESLNFCSLWNLPVLFVVEDNGIAQSTPQFQQIAGTIRERFQAFGIAYRKAFHDPAKLLPQAREAIEDVRHSCRPGCLHVETVRLSSHSKGDDTRNPSSLEQLRNEDPLNQFIGSFPTETVSHWDNEIRHQIRRTLEACQEEAKL